MQYQYIGADAPLYNYVKVSVNGKFRMGEGGENLNYTDDELDSYEIIWDGSITDTGKNDHKRVVKALKNISKGSDIDVTVMGRFNMGNGKEEQKTQ